MSIHVVGGLYREICARPTWNYIYGSAGRAAAAIAAMGDEVSLHTYATSHAIDEYQLFAGWLPGKVILSEISCDFTIEFQYIHDSARPKISDVPESLLEPIKIKEDRVVRFGMLEGDAIVDAEWAVYDPQNVGAAALFRSNGSTARHLALVLNLYEARVMSNNMKGTAEECARSIAERDDAEVVIIKMGPLGALVWSKGDTSTVPAYVTKNVWKIGSGDMFVAHFAKAWMGDGISPHEAAAAASKATAYYCETQIMPNADQVRNFDRDKIDVSPEFIAGKRPQVYLAGPFFDTAQTWFIDEVRKNLLELGLKVFSPFHDIGMGSARDVVKLDIKGIEESDLMFAVADGLDAGTIYEIGYARALGKNVVVLCEREPDESMKMPMGSDCFIYQNYTTALYAVLWVGATQ